GLPPIFLYDAAAVSWRRRAKPERVIHLRRKTNDNQYRNENRREKGPARRSGLQAERGRQAGLQHAHPRVDEQERQGEKLRDRQRPLRDFPEHAETSGGTTEGGRVSARPSLYREGVHHHVPRANGEGEWSREFGSATSPSGA